MLDNCIAQEMARSGPVGAPAQHVRRAAQPMRGRARGAAPEHAFLSTEVLGVDEVQEKGCAEKAAQLVPHGIVAPR